MTTYKSYILTANDLLQGDVIYLAKPDNWTRSLDEAMHFRSKDDANTELNKANANLSLVGPYIFEVDPTKPIHFREEFRAKGPSNYFHGKQELENV